MKHFANRRQLGIEPAQSRVPFRPECSADIRERVDAVSIQARCFRPPDAVLQKILLHHGILRVHVRQNPEEPAFRKISFHAHRGVRIDQRFERIVSDGLTARLAVKAAFERRKRFDVMLRRAVKPVGQRRIRNPGMFRADVIRNDVKKNLHSILVRSSDQVLVVLQPAKMCIDGIEVHGAVSVVVLRSPVLHDGC